jgi:hypothetical protein
MEHCNRPDVPRAARLPLHPKVPRQRSRPQRGSQRHLPWGSVPFDENSRGDRCASAYLTDTFRSQGFSPSQRFDPTVALRLCFAPLPPIGFRPSELFPPGQPRCLSAPRALLPSGRQISRISQRRMASRPTRSLRNFHRPRLQSLDPTKHPTPNEARLALRRAAALLASSLSEANQIDRWACALPSCASVNAIHRRNGVSHTPALQGLNPAEPEPSCKHAGQPP